MPLTKKEQIILADILAKLNKAEQFIRNERTEIHTKYGNNSTPINKEIGSDICYLYRAQEALNTFLNPEPTEPWP